MMWLISVWTDRVSDWRREYARWLEPLLALLGYEARRLVCGMLHLCKRNCWFRRTGLSEAARMARVQVAAERQEGA